MIVKRKQKQFGRNFLNVMGAFGKEGNFAKALGNTSNLSKGQKAWEFTKGAAKTATAVATPVALGGLALPTIAANSEFGIHDV